MSELARHIDVLTGAYKRFYIEEQLTSAVARSRKRNVHLCVVHIDIDDLEEMNDLHGFESVNPAIGAVAETISNIVDGRGPIGRIGGDEFAIILEDVSLERARRIAHRIRQSVPHRHFFSDLGSFRLTVSIGVASRRTGELSGNVLDAAEEACRRAKLAGRDSVVAR